MLRRMDHMEAPSQPSTQQRQIDLERVVVDPDYRRAVIDLLNGRNDAAAGRTAANCGATNRSN